MGAFAEFEAFSELADRLIGEMSKDQVADCASMLALHVADYRARFGEIPRSDLLSLAGAVEISDEQAEFLRDGMEVLVGYLGSVRGELDGDPTH